MDRPPDTAWLERMPEQHGPWEEPGWNCCGDSDCQFRSKCADSERLDAAFLASRAER